MTKQSTPKHRIPEYRLHKPSNQAYVRLSGRQIYLGIFDTPESKAAYKRILAEWLAGGCTFAVPQDQLTVVELLDAYLKHATAYYVRPDGTSTSTLARVEESLRPIRDTYGLTPAVEFGPKRLRAIVQHWIEKGLARSTINDYTAEVKRMFRWAVSHEMISPHVHQALASVEGLRYRRSGAKETDPIKPVIEVHIGKIEAHVSRQVWALVQLQLLTGARPGELVRLRAIDFDRSAPVWTATISEHKTAWRGKIRTLFFGPKAQAIVREFMADRPVNAFLFSPKDAERERAATAPTHRRKNQKPNPRKTDRTLGDCYDVSTYRKAIARACRKAGVPMWSPHKLRHNAATRVRSEFGLEAAQAIMGHASADVTQIYAEVNMARAVNVASQLG